AHLTDQARIEMSASGVEDIDIAVSEVVKSAKTENREVFLEATLTVEASGRPRIADS
ncbi:MAG: hypothetical protein ACI8YI_000624, partial [Paracoccaceae bacterium]